MPTPMDGSGHHCTYSKIRGCVCPTNIQHSLPIRHRVCLSVELSQLILRCVSVRQAFDNVQDTRVCPTNFDNESDTACLSVEHSQLILRRVSVRQAFDIYRTRVSVRRTSIMNPTPRVCPSNSRNLSYAVCLSVKRSICTGHACLSVELR